MKLVIIAEKLAAGRGHGLLVLRHYRIVRVLIDDLTKKAPFNCTAEEVLCNRFYKVVQVRFTLVTKAHLGSLWLNCAHLGLALPYLTNSGASRFHLPRTNRAA
jgi:hypothetical protein